MGEKQTEPNEPNQKAIDAGSAALLRLPDDCTELAKATARQMAKDGGYEDWRVCLAPACSLVRRLAVREAIGRWRGQAVSL
jgi:hypothetical protein